MMMHRENLKGLAIKRGASGFWYVYDGYVCLWSGATRREARLAAKRKVRYGSSP